MTPHADWRMPQGRGDLSGCGAHDQTVGQRAGEANPADERRSTGGTDTSSASGCAARLHQLREREGSWGHPYENAMLRVLRCPECGEWLELGHDCLAGAAS